jgi:hypothetical protein
MKARLIPNLIALALTLALTAACTSQASPSATATAFAPQVTLYPTITVELPTVTATALPTSIPSATPMPGIVPTDTPAPTSSPAPTLPAPTRTPGQTATKVEQKQQEQDDAANAALSPALAAPAGALPLSLRVHPERPGAAIPGDFMGLSYEAGVLSNGPFDPGNATLLQLVRNLGNGTLRFGASEVETTYWLRAAGDAYPRPTAILQTADIDRLFAFARASGWRVILGVNLGHSDENMAAEQAAYAAKVGGASLLAVEFGNEPDMFVRSGLRRSDWGYGGLRHDFGQYLGALHQRAPGVAVAGPGTCCETQWFSDFVRDERAALAFATHHVYPLSAHPSVPSDSPHYASINNLLSPATMQRTLSHVDGLVGAAGAQQLGLWIEETNSASSEGRDGVSNVFASALWGADYLFALAEHTVRGVNLHGRFECRGYTPICAVNGGLRAQPVYYSMLLFRLAARGRMLPVELDGASNVSAHAVLASNNLMRVVLINKEAQQAVTVHIAAGKRVLRASAQRLTAPALNAAEGITLAGSAVSARGGWAARITERVPSRADGADIVVPPASAVVVTLNLG